MQRVVMKVTNPVGLHARPAAEFVKRANQFSADIRIRNLTQNTAWANAKSILGVLTLGVEKGHEIEVTAEGADANEAFRALCTLVESDFGEQPLHQQEWKRPAAEAAR